MLKVLKWIGIGFGGLIILVIVLAIAFPESDETAQSGDAPSPTAEALASPTEVRPTATPLPPTPTRDSSAEAIPYFAWARESAVPAISSNLTELGQLFSNPLPGHEPWREEVRERATLLITTRDEARSRVPPEILKDAHESLMGALEAYAEAGALVLTFLDTEDDSVLNLAGAKLEEGSKLIALATLQIKDAAK